METLFESFRQNLDRIALIDKNQPWTYGQLLDRVERETTRLKKEGVKTGSIVSLRADASLDGCAALLACLRIGTITAPLASAGPSEIETAERILPPDFVISASSIVRWSADEPPRPALIERLREQKTPGLVVFSSASAGPPKAILHDFERFLGGIPRRSKALRTVIFLRFDHLGGLNTLFYTWNNGGTAVLVEDRRPRAICEIIESHRVELLPVTPSFLTVLLASEEDRSWDLSSLKILSYGAEVMPPSVLERVRQRLPRVSLRQTYGLSELGALPVRQCEGGSVWMQPGSATVTTKVVNGTLWIRSAAAMLGYLNAPNPFDEEGWLDTGDEVEVKGEFLRVLGRKTDSINVGGNKVFPGEVESVVGELANIRNVVVFGEENRLLGQIVVARVSLLEDEPHDQLRHRIRLHCAARLSPHKRPMRVIITSGDLTGSRLKKDREAKV